MNRDKLPTNPEGGQAQDDRAVLVTSPAVTVSLSIDGHEYTATLTPPTEEHAYTAVTIYRDHVWAGDGHWVQASEGRRVGAIVDCAADLGDAVYEALDEAIQDVLDEVTP